MSDWLKTLLGVHGKEIPAGSTTSFEFARLPHGATALLLLLFALALVAGVVWVYRREGSAPMRIKLGLAALRALVFVCALVLVLEPVLSVDQVEKVDKTTVLLLDASLSMTTRDGYRDPVARSYLQNYLDGRHPSKLPRYRIADLALEKSGLVGLLARNNRVAVFPFSDVLGPPFEVPRAKAGAPPPPAPPYDLSGKKARRAGAKGTNLAGAIRQAVESVGSDRVAAIVLVSDGRNNLGPPASDIALYLRNKDLRLHTVVVGEAEPPRNLRVVALAGPDRIYAKDPASFEARLASQGYGASTVTFERRYTGGADDWEQVGSQTLAFPAGGRPVTVKFSDRPPHTGTLEYRARLDVELDEANRKDNVKRFMTRVVEEKAKVLFVAGAPGHEYYAVKNVLLRDSTITLACFLQSADPEFPQDGNIHIKAVPADEKALFSYDVILLYDPDPDKLPPDWLGLLDRFVAKHRGGLGFIAGNKHTLNLLRSASEETGIAALLPVVLDLYRADQPGIGIGFGSYFKTPWRMDPTPAGLRHPITRFHSDPHRARDLVWERLPPFFWFFPVLKEKPGATVLARHDDPRETVPPYGRRPVLAVQRYGGGRVMFLATDGTFRWRSVAENVFDRFWIQAARWLVEGRLAGARRRFRVYLDRELVDLGDAIKISAEVFDERFEPLEAPEVAVKITGPADLRETLSLTAVDGAQGHFTGSFAPPAEGGYELRAAEKGFRPEGPKGTQGPAARFRAELPQREMGDVRADPGLLRDLAARSRGRSPPVHEIETLGDPKLIPPMSERVITQGRPIPLWDTWTTIIVMLALLCAEWILRKLYRMV